MFFNVQREFLCTRHAWLIDCDDGKHEHCRRGEVPERLFSSHQHFMKQFRKIFERTSPNWRLPHAKQPSNHFEAHGKTNGITWKHWLAMLKDRRHCEDGIRLRVLAANIYSAPSINLSKTGTRWLSSISQGRVRRLKIAKNYEHNFSVHTCKLSFEPPSHKRK